MSEPRGAALPALGARIRTERLRRGVSLRGLARDIGVSASLISQIETEKSRPSVSTLYAITSALGIPVEDLFDADGPGDTSSSDGAGSPNGSGAAAGPTEVHDDGPAGRVRPADQRRRHPRGTAVDPTARERLTLDSGVTWERLGQMPDAHFDFLLITYAPGGTSSSGGELMRHKGTEYGYLVSGELVLTLGPEDHRLAAGDSVSFDSSTPHRFRNDGDIPAVGVWFVLERG
jgi:transcriptional regulator with XRE-family HTH domain/quercetin dioxygenase-like cupin family protein